MRFHAFGFALLATLPLCAQDCETPSDIKAALEAISSSKQTSPNEHIAAARTVRDRFPDQYYAHKYYQDQLSSGGLFSKALQDEYHALLEQHPDDALYLLLYARTLKGTNTPEAVRLLDRVLAKDPDSAMAHLKLVEIYSAPAFRDEQKLTAHADAFWKVCPASLSGYSYVSRVEDTAFLARASARLRPVLQGRTDTEALFLYGTLWTMEFKAVPLSEQDAVRQRVRQDVALLRAHDDGKNLVVLNELSQGYKLLGDSEGTKWADAQRAERGMPGVSPAAQALRDWRQSHPSRTSDMDDQRAQLLKMTEQWIRQWPDDPELRRERFEALWMSQDAPLEDSVAAAEDWIRVYEKHPASMSPYMQVANFYSRHNIRYAELPDLLEKALKGTTEAPPSPVSDLYPSRAQTASFALSAVSTKNSAARIYIQIKMYGRARELLAQIGPVLATEKPPESASDSDKQRYKYAENAYWSNMAKLARLEGNKADRLTYERSVLLSNPNSNPQMIEYQTRTLRELWKDVKGTEDGFEAWLGVPVPAAAPKAPTIAATQSAWTKLDKPLPDFQISDENGKTWRLADLKGKVALVNVWATWCGPCRQELPDLQKLFNKVRERKDLVVITLNTDDNPGMIGPFLTENKYTFPVLPASAYVSKLVPELSIPRNWIVDANGVMRLERVGFNRGGDQWIEDMIADMEKARLQ